MEPVSTGISVIEIPARGQSIPVSREGVTAFVGPAPRGPADIPVAVRSLEEFLLRFGVPGYLSRMELLLYQYFENGGTLAIVVRVCRSRRRNRVVLPGPSGDLTLEALNPGPLEHLRACVDYEGLVVPDRLRFNLVVHRCRSPEHPLVEEQESFPAVSVREGDRDFVGDVLAASGLVRLAGPAPGERPFRTLGGDAGHGVRYVYGQSASATGAEDNSPTDYDLIGSREEGTGLFALEQLSSVDFVCLVPGQSGTSLGPVAAFAADRYCRERHALLLLDPPGDWSGVDAVVKAQRQRGFASPNAVTYFPPLENPPHASVGGGLSAAGAIAGALCAGGLATGDRLPLSLGRSRPVIELDPGDVHQLACLGVNALARIGPARVELAGMVTMARSGGVSTSWNSLRERRVFLFAVQSLARHTRWAAFETPAPALWQELRVQCTHFLSALQANGLLAGRGPSDGFYVKCDHDTHAGLAGDTRVVLIVGLALVRPREFVAVEIRHTAQRFSVSELGWQPGLALAG